MMRRILHETEADQYRVFIGGEDNFRYQIYPEYKGNRTDKPRPPWLQDTRAYLVEHWNAEIVNGIETDDRMGIEQCAEENTIIVTNDKDLLMIPGNHYNPITGFSPFITPLDGLKHFYQQLIQGDSSDNIPGYDGKMRPKIPKFLQPTIDRLWDCTEESEMLEIVLDMYHDDRETVLRNGRLLWIHRKENDEWNFPSL